MERLLTLNEIADRLGVSPKTIYKWSHLGKIPVARAGRLLRFDEVDVMKWLKRDVSTKQPSPGKKKKAEISPLRKSRACSEVNSIVKSAISEVLD